MYVILEKIDSLDKMTFQTQPNKKLAIETLGKIGVIQADSSSEILQILIDIFQNREQEDGEDDQDIKEVAINTATELVLNLPPKESNSELINHLIVFVRRTENNYLLFVAVHSLRRLTQKYLHRAFSTVENILRIFAVKFKENIHRTRVFRRTLKETKGCP